MLKLYVLIKSFKNIYKIQYNLVFLKGILSTTEYAMLQKTTTNHHKMQAPSRCTCCVSQYQTKITQAHIQGQMRILAINAARLGVRGKGK